VRAHQKGTFKAFYNYLNSLDIISRGLKISALRNAGGAMTDAGDIKLRVLLEFLLPK
jgi:hypothetical protein